ncbi:SWI2/SNF2-containing protein RAD5 [Cardiosporidium cionae]|uniref:SWI2/SNF2-containing protein RAD5 n=1 Tax=Cardiosporidium cionae TaxID=476202 RepID=A0ABQ7J733_9APIC|nr:SWI2/SNF2-containing protein RAD5 [Cardiosporidium cionae]|eukprot:KAF8819796.1 SWI2/SNF2-containing protein RAD5 [Cardiosporidium cionae]
MATLPLPIRSLSPVQLQILREFMMISTCEDENHGIKLLYQSKWDLNTAINWFFNHPVVSQSLSANPPVNTSRGIRRSETEWTEEEKRACVIHIDEELENDYISSQSKALSHRQRSPQNGPPSEVQTIKKRTHCEIFSTTDNPSLLAKSVAKGISSSGQKKPSRLPSSPLLSSPPPLLSSTPPLLPSPPPPPLLPAPPSSPPLLSSLPPLLSSPPPPPPLFTAPSSPPLPPPSLAVSSQAWEAYLGTWNTDATALVLPALHLFGEMEMELKCNLQSVSHKRSRRRKGRKTSLKTAMVSFMQSKSSKTNEIIRRSGEGGVSIRLYLSQREIGRCSRFVSSSLAPLIEAQIIRAYEIFLVFKNNKELMDSIFREEEEVQAVLRECLQKLFTNVNLCPKQKALFWEKETLSSCSKSSSGEGFPKKEINSFLITSSTPPKMHVQTQSTPTKKHLSLPSPASSTVDAAVEPINAPPSLHTPTDFCSSSSTAAENTEAEAQSFSLTMPFEDSSEEEMEEESEDSRRKTNEVFGFTGEMVAMKPSLSAARETQALKENRLYPSVDVFKTQLRPYQAEALGWMYTRENQNLQLTRSDGSLSTYPATISLHPMWEQYCFPRWKESPPSPSLSNEKSLGALGASATPCLIDPRQTLPTGVSPFPYFYYNRATGQLSLDFPEVAPDCRGGILADEMGLGKTVEMLSLLSSDFCLRVRSSLSQSPTYTLEAISPLRKHSPLLKAHASTEGDRELLPPCLHPPSPLENSSLKTLHPPEKNWVDGQSHDTVVKKNKILAFVGSASSTHLKLGGTLIILPLSLMSQWKMEIEKHMQPCAYTVLDYYGVGRTKSVEVLLSYSIILTTYATISNEFTGTQSHKDENMTRTTKEFLKTAETSPLWAIHWHRIILDEAHCIKNRNTRQCKAVCTLQAECRWCLSGTPIQNAIEDIYALVQFLRVEPWNHWTWWSKLVMDPLHKGNIKGAIEACRRVVSPLMLRRTKESKDENGKPILQLPPKCVHTLWLQMSTEERQFYDAVFHRTKTKFDSLLQEGHALRQYTHVLQLLLRLRQACCHPFLLYARSGTKVLDNAEELDELMVRFLKSAKSQGLSLSEDYLRSQLHMLKQGEPQECPICLEAAVDPVVGNCCHVLCRECALNLLRRPKSAHCPTCRATLHEKQLRGLPGVSKLPNAILRQLSGIESSAENFFKNKSTRDTADTAADKNKMETRSDVTTILNIMEKVAIKKQPFMFSTKLARLRDFLFEDAEQGRNAVVFSQWTSYFDILEEMLKTFKLQFKRLDGSLTLENRSKVLKWFSRSEEAVSNISTEIQHHVDTSNITAPRRDRDARDITLLQNASILPKLRMQTYDNVEMTNHMLYSSENDYEKISQSDNLRARVLLCSLKAGGVGLNLIAASRVYLMDLWWNPAIEEQAFQRVHRIGQMKEVNIYRFVMEHSVEERILQLHASKKNTAESVLTGEKLDQKFEMNKLTLEDLKLMFKGWENVEKRE